MTTTRLAALWTAAILVACSVPGDSLPGFQFLPFSFDKWVHVGLFLVFGALWLRAKPGRGWIIFAWGIAFAVGIEVWQGLLPIGRSPDPLDAVADAVGLMLGLGLARWMGNDPSGDVSR